jgi:hypothetical protein
VKEIEDWMLRYIKRAGLAAQLLMESSFRRIFCRTGCGSVSRSLIYFLDDTWRHDFLQFNYILDAKLPAKMAAGRQLPERRDRVERSARKVDHLGRYVATRASSSLPREVQRR